MSKTYLGVKDGKLAPCPSSPNCVSTQAEDDSKKMAPLPFVGDLKETKDHVSALLKEMDRTEVENETERYLHAVVTSKLMKFKDDVEFYFDEEEGLVHFRSASRVGYSDMGVNRKRMESFTTSYNEQVKGAE
ncbi:DUF1499 domain-containing protein [Halobacillus fulvus]|nr:DUF1499 domain-containing protein [Halobacillus fulvus]